MSSMPRRNFPNQKLIQLQENYFVQIIHNRLYYDNGVVHPRGGNTIVLVKDKKTRKLLSTCASVCSPKDNFCRREGVNQALKRLPALSVPASVTNEELIHALMCGDAI